MYAGGLLFFLGWSLFAGPVALVVTGALAVLWAGKTAVEERHLRTAYPAYDQYAARVRFRLVPWIY
jgi:protein-S-isoprenylcysteine O-methyltransferase Ste14